MSEQPPSELVRGIKAGDDAAWQLTIERFQRPLLQIVRRQVPAGIRAKVDAEDILQKSS